jgi:hypothetical protein
MRAWSAVLDNLIPSSINASPPEETVAASRGRKRDNQRDLPNLRGKKADKVWTTKSMGREVAWMETKPSPANEDPVGAEKDVLKACKGAKDMLDSLLKEKVGLRHGEILNEVFVLVANGK